MTDAPGAIRRIAKALEEAFPGTVEFEAVSDGKRYRFGIVSSAFEGVPDLVRQDRAWELVDKVCTREESMMISLIIIYAPSEWAPAHDKASA